jgi:hypothetical protein
MTMRELPLGAGGDSRRAGGAERGVAGGGSPCADALLAQPRVDGRRGCDRYHRRHLRRLDRADRLWDRLGHRRLREPRHRLALHRLASSLTCSRDARTEDRRRPVLPPRPLRRRRGDPQARHRRASRNELARDRARHVERDRDAGPRDSPSVVSPTRSGRSQPVAKERRTSSAPTSPPPCSSGCSATLSSASGGSTPSPHSSSRRSQSRRDWRAGAARAAAPLADRAMSRTWSERVRNPFNWVCNCDPSCWCNTIRWGHVLMWYIPPRFHRFPRDTED